MTRFTAGLLAIAALGFLAVADDKKDDKKDDQLIKGTWVREAEGLTLSFNFKTKTELEVAVEGGGNGATLTCKYTVDKEGKLKATVTDVKEKGDFPAKPPKGFEFKCVFKVEKDTAKITDFEGEGADGAKAVVEGEYKKKKDD